MPNDDTAHFVASADVNPNLVCDHPRCGSKVFKRKGDLTRHQKLHEQRRNFPCMAQECDFSFTRNDKLMDHIRAGHEAEDLFACPDCSMLLTRDVLPLHGYTTYIKPKDYSSLDRYRQCPLPRCKFRTPTSSSGLDRLRDHLLKDHDPKGRKRYEPLLASRGYDHQSANIVCPICTESTTFDEHKEFGFHFLEMHCLYFSAVNSDPRCDPQICRAIKDGDSDPWSWQWRWQKWDVITDEQREHRHTILSLFPAFGTHPVWEDIKRCCSVMIRRDCQRCPLYCQVIFRMPLFSSYIFTYIYLRPSLVVHTKSIEYIPKKIHLLETLIEHIHITSFSQPKPHHRPTSTPTPRPQTRHIPNTRPPSRFAAAPLSHVAVKHARARSTHQPHQPCAAAPLAAPATPHHAKYQTRSRQQSPGMPRNDTARDERGAVSSAGMAGAG